jgi:hypothetical protein
MRVTAMTNTSNKNRLASARIQTIVFTLAFISMTWFFCQAEPIEAKVDRQTGQTIKIHEQKSNSKPYSTHLQFDKQAHLHRFTLPNKQDLALDQGF